MSTTIAQQFTDLFRHLSVYGSGASFRILDRSTVECLDGHQVALDAVHHAFPQLSGGEPASIGDHDAVTIETLEIERELLVHDHGPELGKTIYAKMHPDPTQSLGELYRTVAARVDTIVRADGGFDLRDARGQRVLTVRTMPGDIVPAYVDLERAVLGKVLP